MNLVVNITKHIHLKQQSQNPEDVDPDELAEYFPSFMWVVRDFSLQLKDRDGEDITPKEYLEGALEEQKGITEQIMEKNRIRKLIKCFFKERDCCTMIRPITGEQQLQDIEQMSIEQLRPEFQKQVYELRAKILHRMRFKVMNGKKITGPMLCKLAEVYVSAINDGAVPNIECAWTYICRNENQKVLGNALDSFQESLNDIMHYLPWKEDALRQEFTSIWEKTLKELQTRLVGGEVEEIEEQLKESMNNGYDHLIEANVIASSEVCQNFLEKYNKEISNKLNHGIYHQYEHYFDDLKAMMAEYNNIVQDGPKKEEKLFKFLIDKQEEGALHFIKILNETLKTDKTMSNERIQKLEYDLKDVRQNLKRELDILEQKIRD